MGLFSDKPYVHFARFAVSVASAVLFLTGVWFRGNLNHVHDSRNNWRAYRCLVSGTDPADLQACDWVSNYRQSCTERYGRFSPLDPEKWPSSYSGQYPEYPPADYLNRSPTSAITSLLFLVVAVVAVIRKFPAFAASLAVVAAGSFSLHSDGASEGHTLDHSGCILASFAAAAISIGYACDHLSLPQWHLYFVPLIAILAVGISFSGSSPVDDVSSVAAIVLFACIFVAAIASFRPIFGFNAGVPLLVGAYIQLYPAGDHELRAECTGVLEHDELYDVVHSLWHIAAAYGFTEVALFSEGPSLLALSSLLFFVPALIESSANLTAPLVLALSAAGCGVMTFFFASSRPEPRALAPKKQYSIYRYKLTM